VLRPGDHDGLSTAVRASGKAILKKLAWVIGGVGAIYAALLAVSLLLYPMHLLPGGLDTAPSGDTIYMTEPKYLFLNRSALRTDEDRLVLLGASNVVFGFRPSELQPLLPKVIVNNLGVSGSNITEVRQAYELIRAAQTPSAPKRTTYVIGIWYGMFVPDALKWHTPDRHAGETDLDIERYRYGFFRRSATGPVEVLPTEYFELGSALIRPYLMIDRLARLGTDTLRAFVKKRPKKTDEQRNAARVTPEDQARFLAFWKAQFGGATIVPDEQFTVLSELVKEMLDSGSKVVIVDLPIPSWHAAQAPLNASYNALRSATLQQFSGKPGFSYLNMQAEFPDDEFVDEAHPKPRARPHWAEKLAEFLGGSRYSNDLNIQ
jgi:hypothetical protein